MTPRIRAIVGPKYYLLRDRTKATLNIARATAEHDRIIAKVESIIATHPDIDALPLASTKVGTRCRARWHQASVTKKELVALCAARLGKIVL